MNFDEKLGLLGTILLLSSINIFAINIFASIGYEMGTINSIIYCLGILWCGFMFLLSGNKERNKRKA